MDDVEDRPSDGTPKEEDDGYESDLTEVEETWDDATDEQPVVGDRPDEPQDEPDSVAEPDVDDVDDVPDVPDEPDDEEVPEADVTEPVTEEPTAEEPETEDGPERAAASWEPTGHGGVDAVLAGLDGLSGRSVHEHVGAFEEAHAALRRALDEADAVPETSPDVSE